MAEKKSLLISCSILRDEIQGLIETTRWDLEVRYLSAKLHYDYNHLEAALEESIQKAKRQEYPKGIVVYGDVCMGFDHQIKDLVNKHGFIKVDALNCVDCLLGGKGRLLEIDPDHKAFFLTPGWIRFWNSFEISKGSLKDRYRMLDGLVLLDSLGNLDEFNNEIEEIVHHTGLPVLEKKAVGLKGLRKVIAEAVEKLDESP
jgi:hypothetical protein